MRAAVAWLDRRQVPLYLAALAVGAATGLGLPAVARPAEAARQRGALYEKALLPFVSHTVVDGRLVTGQNPGSARATARKVADLL